MFAVQVYDYHGVGEALIGGAMVVAADCAEVSRQIREQFAGRYYYFNCQRL